MAFCRRGTSLLPIAVLIGVGPAAAAEFASHPPMRLLPQASQRPLNDGPAYFVAPSGNDQQPGTKAQPWKTVGHGIKQLKPGDTLYLRAGTYYETVRIAVSGTAERPITLCSFPGEVAVLDAGHREFFESPAKAWEPVPGGGPDEFRSVKTYETGGTGGNFGDSMIPFHRYLTWSDLRSNNELHHAGLENRLDDPRGIYCGPGSRRDQNTGRIHVRLSHTKLDGLGVNHYRGETDPRKLPLVIVGADFGMVMEGAKHVRIQDLVLRGAKDVAARISHGENIEFDGVTMYANFMALRTDHTRGLRVVHSAIRGHAAPWHSRFHHKNRAGSGYLLLTGADDADFEFAHCELTDHHDCMTFRSVDGMAIHHCLIDNFNDDGIEPGPKKERGRTYVYQNLISRVLSPFTAHGDRTEPMATEPGSGMYVYRNIVDLREGTYKSPPDTPDASGAFLNYPTELILHDHGSPTQANYYVYHNTFVLARKPYRNYYAFTWGAHSRDTVRRVFNNIFVQVDDPPALNFAGIGPDDDLHADGNLYWAAKQGRDYTGDVFAELKRTPLSERSKRGYAPGWSASDQFADPNFMVDGSMAKQPRAWRLQPDSPASDAGIAISADWPDPLRALDTGRPDIGAIPAGVEPWTVGVERTAGATGN